MNRKILYAALALTVAAAGTAFAQQTATGAGQTAPRAKLDANGDGAIDRNEAAKHERLAARFDELDKNKDGKLGADERPQWRGRHGRGGGHMTKADKDGDGKISKAEAAAEPKLAERFDQMDANKDGFVDRSDREQMGREHREQWFADADANKDGKISKVEMDGADAKRRAEFQQKWQARSADRFQKMDQNGDGSISRDEMDAARGTKR